MTQLFSAVLSYNFVYTKIFFPVIFFAVAFRRKGHEKPDAVSHRHEDA